MKRHLTLLLLLLPLMAFAQHLQFMGIPLNGTISNFQSKLLAKGIKVSKYNSSMPVGYRLFEGRFSGYQSDIYVYYIPSSKIVYRAKACIERSTESEIENMLESFKDNIMAKYGDGCAYAEDTYNGYPTYSILILNQTTMTVLGNVELYITKDDNYPYNYVLHVDYNDYKNSEKNDQYNMDDL